MSVRFHAAHVLALATIAMSIVACETEREGADADAPTFREHIGPLLAARCGACHGDAEPEAGYRVDSFLDAAACVPDGRAALLPDQDGAVPLLVAIGREDHRGFLSADERALVARWIAAGAPARGGFVHQPGIIDPRSDGWHGRLATANGYRRMLDPTRDDACGRCHEGAPTQRDGDDFRGLNGATSCTTCHTAQGGVLACGTCHGTGADPLPPRDVCFFPDGPAAGAHDAHLQAPAGLTPAALECATCHPVPGMPVLSGTHGDGNVDVVLPEDAEDWVESAFDPQAKTCTGGCHNVATLAWNDPDQGPLECQGCHTSPPPNHSPSPCSNCHRDVKDDGSGLLPGAPHLDGHIDLGDGTGRCGTCHGDGTRDAWPQTGAHRAHRHPRWGAPVACETCHVVPETVLARGHIDDTSAGPEITFSGVARARGASPTYDTGACSGTACHAQTGAEHPTPRWDEDIELSCTSCHALPPAPPHTTWNQCSARLCHGGEVIIRPEGLEITPLGRERHVNGVVNLGVQ